MTARAVAYYRVSSGPQALGVSLDAQRTTVRRYVEYEGMELVSEFKEAESAYRSAKPTWRRRPRLKQALRECKRHKAMLVIAALDRLARNVVFIATLIETRVNFTALDMPDATPFMIHIYAAIAEEESRQKGLVVKATLALAKERGQRWDQEGQRRKAAADKRAELLRPIVDELRALGERGTYRIARALNERGISQFGRPWSTIDARRLLKRLGYHEKGAAPVFRQHQLAAEARSQILVPIVTELRASGLTGDQIAAQLNERGHRTARGLLWTTISLWDVMRRYRRRQAYLSSVTVRE
jgi:DNA invertase Pin-like site-specific DNA recombinase